MQLTERLHEYISACFTGIWIQSHEHQDAIAEITQLCRQESWRLACWDLEQGLTIPGSETALEASDPLAAIRAVNALVNPDNAEGSALLVLQKFHKFINSAEIIQAIARQVLLGKQNRTFLLVLSPLVSIPVELEKLFVVLEHELPGRDQLEQIARSIATEDNELPDGDDLRLVLDASAGLTRYEAEGAFSLSLVRQGKISPQAIWELKSQTLKKSGLLSLHRGQESFAQLGGMDNLKAFCLRAMRRQGQRDPLRRPRGVLLLSPPGCGKSQFAKTLDDEDFGRSDVAGGNLVDSASNRLGSCAGFAYNPDMNEQAKKATKRTRRWLTVSLRTFLLAITVLCVWLGFIVNRVNKQKQAVAWVRENGGTVYYDFEWDQEKVYRIKDAQPPGPDWLRNRIGVDYFADVVWVNLSEQQIIDIAPLAVLNELCVLDLSGTQVSDLAPLARMKHLQWLSLENTRILDVSPLAGLNRLEWLYLNKTQISNLSPLAGIKGLKHFWIGDTNVSNLSPLTDMKAMIWLDLNDTPVSDLSPLIGMNDVTIRLRRDQNMRLPPELESQVIRD